MNAFVCVIFLTLPPVDEVVRRFENSLALIHSFECDFRTTTSGKPGISGKYCRRGSDVAIQGVSRGQAFSAWCHDGKRWFYNPAGTIKASLLPGTGGDMGQGNVWANALLEVSLGGRHGVPLAELFRSAKSTKCEVKEGNYLVTGTAGEDQFEVLFAEKQNCMPLQVSLLMPTQSGDPRKGETTVVQWFDQGTIYFPARVVSKLLVGGKAVAEGEFFFENIRVNHEIPASRFVPRFPPGTILADRIEGKVYYIDEAGRKIRDHESFVVVKEDWKEVLKPQGQAPAAFGQQSPLGEGTPLLHWLLYGFAAFLAVALILWFVQRQRLRRAEAN